MIGKRGQITVFIIIGLIILFAIGTYLYLSGEEAVRHIEAKRPTVAEIPQQIQPLRDLVDGCINHLGKDGLIRIGNTGGYIDDKQIFFNPMEPTEGEGVQLAPGTPAVAYWWHMKSENNCQNECEFGTKRPGLYRDDGGVNIEAQLDKYVTENLRECLDNFDEYQKTTGCTVQELNDPQITANVAQDDVFFVGKYQIRATCGEQTFDLEDYYVTHDVNLREIYTLATNLTNMEASYFFLEQTTKTIIDAFSEVDGDKLPPSKGGLEVGAFLTPEYWALYQVEQDLKQVLSSYIPAIQAYGTRNYRFKSAPEDTRDELFYEVIYNRHFYLPMEETHRSLELRFNYFDWWKPYLDLGCNGQICTADSGSAMIPPLFITVNRYNFPYDLSYPVMVELRNPDTFNEQGYVFRFMLEQNLRNSEPFDGAAPPFEAITTGKPPSIFCNPGQRTSGDINITAKDTITLQPIDDAAVSYTCGDQFCAIGNTEEGKLTSKFPRCIGGILRLTKIGYQSYSIPFDLLDETQINVNAKLDPKKTLKAKVRNYILTKPSKRGGWEFIEGPPLAPETGQETIIQLKRNGNQYEEQYFAFVQLDGKEIGEIDVVPGNYTVSITSFLRKNITIPKDERCVKIKKLFGSKKKCYNVPEEEIKFNAEKPFPYGFTEFQWYVNDEMLRNVKEVEFRQFVLGIDKIQESNRVVEDLEQIEKIKLYAISNKDSLRPKVT